MEQKIYSEFTEDELDQLPIKEIKNSIGWVDYDSDTKTWDVTTRGMGGFACLNQESAHIMANTEMILELLLRK